MCVPFFILAGNFLTHGGVARAHDPLRHRHGRALAGRPRASRASSPARSSPPSPARRRRPSSPIGSIMIPAMTAAGLPAELRCRRRRLVGRARHPDSALDRHGALFGRQPAACMVTGPAGEQRLGRLGRRPLHGRRHSGHRARRSCSASPPSTVRGATAIRGRRGPAGPSAARLADSFWGLALIVIIMGGIYGGLFTPTEAAASERRLCLRRRGLRLQGLAPRRRAARAARIRAP